MKKLLLLCAFLASSSAFAGVSDVEPSQDRIRPSLVEQVIVLQKETKDTPSIKLIQVDNGGSTDISSYVSPSRLYLSLHSDSGADVSYLVADSLVRIEGSFLNSSDQSVSITLITRDDEMKHHGKVVRVYIGDAVKAAKSQQPFTTVGVQNIDL